MSHVLLAALLVASATATAQTSPTPAPESGTPAASTPATSAPAAATPAGSTEAAPQGELSPEAQAELDRRLEAAKAEMREEIRAQMATQSLSSDWQEEWTEERRKLELFTLDGFFRVRPNLFYKFDLGKPQGRELFPRSPRAPGENTQAGANMRVRLEPTFNVSEEVRLKLQVDLLDNILLGSTPDSSFEGSDRDIFAIFSESQDPPSSGVNALKDSLSVKRAYGEVSTPVGILRFGRMGSHWGLGMLRNDGNCLDCDFGDTVDRVQFVTEPFAGFYVTPMIDFNAEGVTSDQTRVEGEPVDLTNSDDSHSYVLAIARRDTDQQAKAKLENNQGVLNYGLHFTYRTQRWENVETVIEDDLSTPDVNEARTELGFIPREATLYMPDLWIRYEERNFRVEAEFATIYGTIGNRALTVADAGVSSSNQSLRVLQFGGLAQGEYRLLNGELNIGLELGFASGDKAPGFGNYPRRVRNAENTAENEGPQYTCDPGGCGDNAIRNFRFNRAYRPDLILWRELLGGVTDAFYVKPSVKYSLADGFDLHGSVIYSQAFYAESTPSTTNTALGMEVDVGARYETEDGFVAGITWGIFFPMAGLQEPPDAAVRPDFETAQALRGTLGIRF
jgi:uncharacterized protein (TIGR04551 family)